MNRPMEVRITSLLLEQVKIDKLEELRRAAQEQQKRGRLLEWIFRSVNSR